MNGKLLLFTVFLVAMLVPNVYAAPDDTVNLQDLPTYLAEKLSIPTFAGQLLACSIFLMMFLLPIAWFARRNMMLTLLVGFILLGFFIAVGWLPYWFLLIISLLVAGLWSAKMKGWVS